MRAGLVRSPADWLWSSYRATASLVRAPAWLTTDAILATFAGNKGEAREAYRCYVMYTRGSAPRASGRT